MTGIFVLWFLALVAVFAYFAYLRASTNDDPKPRGMLGVIITAVIFVSSFIFVVIIKPWAFVENYELGYKFDMRTGQITTLDRSGYHMLTPIFESVHTVDLRPRQVCININMDQNSGANSANRRVLNCKLVQFNKDGLKLFLEWHGRNDYYGDSFDDLLKIYAYDGSGRGYPFLTVLRELKSADDAPVTATNQE